MLVLQIALPAQAESGSAQSLMFLVVPPNGNNLMTGALSDGSPSSSVAGYKADTNLNMVQRIGNVTYRIWMSL